MTITDEERAAAIAATAELAELVSIPPELESRWLITAPGVYDMPSDIYHRDPVRGGSLSSTGIRKLVEPGGPAKYRWAHDHPREDHTESFDFGRAAHQLVLSDPDDRVVIVNADDWRTKAAQQQRDEARAAGLTPVLAKQWEVVEAMAAAILAHPLAAKLLAPDSGKPEQTLVWQDHVSGIWLRARVDWLRHRLPGQRLLLTDYKTTKAADAESFARSSADYGYFVQAEFYRAGAIALGLDPDPAFLFVAQDKDAPYLVSVMQHTEDDLILGRNLMRNAINVFADCTRTGSWPGYPNEVQTIELPAWFRRQYDEE